MSWREQVLEICTHRIQSEHGFLPFENQVGPSRSPFFLGDSATRRPEPWLCFSRDSAPSHPWVYEPLRATCFLVSKTIAHTQGIQRPPRNSYRQSVASEAKRWKSAGHEVCVVARSCSSMVGLYEIGHCTDCAGGDERQEQARLRSNCGYRKLPASEPNKRASTFTSN